MKSDGISQAALIVNVPRKQTLPQDRGSCLSVFWEVIIELQIVLLFVCQVGLSL